MMQYFWSFLFSCFVFLCFSSGLWNILFNDKANQCEMTYMYETPNYFPVPVRSESNYRLFIYGEGAYFNHVSKLDLSGIPVIFVPGHGGSYKQVRSIGSVLLRKALNRGKGVHFNVFAVDYNEEWVGLYGGTYHDQVQFLRQSISTVLSLYKSTKQPPRSVVLLGHSIGGVVCRGLFMLDHFDASSVSIILTFASPNLSPVINVDVSIATFYDDVNNYWVFNGDDLSNVTVLSVSGGEKDFQVRHSITSLPGRTSNQLSTSLSVVPGVHLTTDHQAIVWCKQLVLVTSRYLFDVVDVSSKQITSDSSKRSYLLHWYFADRFSSLNNAVHIASNSKLSRQYTKTIVTDFLWSYQPHPHNGTYYIFSIDHYLDKNASAFAARIRSTHNKWVFLCGFQHCVDVSQHSIKVSDHRILQFDLSTMNDVIDVVIRVPPITSSTHVTVNVLTSLHQSQVTVPSVFSNLWTFNKGFKYFIEPDEDENRFFYRISLNSYRNIFQTFEATISDPSSYLRFEVPWDQGQVVEGTGKLSMKLLTTPVGRESAFLNVYSDHNHLTLNIRVEVIKMLDSLLRHFATSLPVLLLANIMLTYRHQIIQLYKSGQCPDASDAHAVGAKPYKVQPIITLLHMLYGFEWFASLWSTLKLPMLDSALLENHVREWFSLSPLIMFLFAYEIFQLEIMLQHLCNFCIVKLMKLFLFDNLVYFATSKYFFVSLHSITLALLLNFHSSYALLYIYLMSVLRYCGIVSLRSQVSKENKEIKGSLKDSEEILPLLFIVSQLWLWLFLFSLPSFIFRTKFPRQSSLSDPSYYQAMVGAIIFVVNNYKGNKHVKYRWLSTLLLPITVLLVTFSMFSIYRANSFIIMFLLLHTCML